jgi:uncharacterized protein (TIGR02598 family)
MCYGEEEVAAKAVCLHRLQINITKTSSVANPDPTESVSFSDFFQCIPGKIPFFRVSSRGLPDAWRDNAQSPGMAKSRRRRSVLAHKRHQIPTHQRDAVPLFADRASESNILLIGKRLTRFANRDYAGNMSNPRRAVCTMRRHRRILSSKGTKAFSLVEVVLAIGVVSFAMMAMLGTLPIGLKSSQESRGQVATANIARQLQGELQQISFNDQSQDALTVASLSGQSMYYTLEGTKTDKVDSAYYVANFAVNGVSLPGLSIDPALARTVTVKLSYPASASEEERQQTVFSLLLAKQKTD